ncbi:hypothetical protein Afil01_31040 [Actinorhabdospora filicis]|uniref:Uncharacterized protein n=1 Tax=Actinorhabdospora filicis TaxID=1785913 RepID=A0A9W6SLU7_9ACTN|nr:hypothetical protein Afil01_31040 [Actinorhabdospora filicis]
MARPAGTAGNFYDMVQWFRRRPPRWRYPLMLAALLPGVGAMLFVALNNPTSFGQLLLVAIPMIFSLVMLVVSILVLMSYAGIGYRYDD